MSIRGYGTGHAVGSREMATLVAIANAGSVRQAAIFLGLTPAAVSKTVRQAEARLGGHVFDRSATGMVPNDASRRLLDAARHTLHQLTAAQEDFRALNGSGARVNNLGIRLKATGPLGDVRTVIQSKTWGIDRGLQTTLPFNRNATSRFLLMLRFRRFV